MRSEREEIYDITTVAESVDQITFEYEAGNLKYQRYYKDGKLLFTLEYVYEAGNLVKIVRT
jgi:antitoxin component YwqK of YwqJK toxin-antitoxin module